MISKDAGMDTVAVCDRISSLQYVLREGKSPGPEL